MQKTWIFQTDRALSTDEQSKVLANLQPFISSWKTHGSPVQGEASFHYDRFLVVKMDDGESSGCSIDGMTREVQKVFSEEKISRLENQFVWYRDQEGNFAHLDFRKFSEAIQSGKISGNTIVFDNSMSQSDDFSKWEVPLSSSWLSRYLSVEQPN